MKTLCVKLYAFDELSDEAKEKAIEKQREKHYDCYWDSVQEEIEALSDIAYAIGANTKVDYEFSTCSPSYIEFKFGDIADDLQGIRAYKYIYNNFIMPFIQGKYYSKLKYIDGKYTYIDKRSKAIKEFRPISGWSIDYIILDVWKEYIEKTRNHVLYDVADFISDIESALCKDILDSAEINDDDESWADRLLDDEREIYTEEGEIY